MKKKSAFLAVLGLAMATTAITAWASPSTFQEKESTPEINMVVPTSGDDTITPYVVDNEWSAPMSATSGSTANHYFAVNVGKGHLKLHMVNQASTPVKATLTHLDSGMVYFTKDIPANGFKDFISFDEGSPQGMRTGNYLIQYIGGVNPVKGIYYGKTGSSKTDF
ncbi:hypothetical protein P4H66_25945 [Paenibacillus dokdonensis]|uniref:Uncharacterized protein n=1 Tax=Paenibacillus dokdonensis TaxID=2567944 RepID=A0ABU6GU84_9BACL|nr:hypothetical protein [Paenibacillus dokdonensis]MEC0243261.1 hypothetical protein [Paenibacillus dokdonensis]